MTLAAARAAQQISAFHPAGRERELVGAPLSGNTEITASLPPFGTVRGESSPAVAMQGKQVGKLVQEGPIHFFEGYLPQGRIQPDLPVQGDGYAGRGPHPGIPSHHNQRSQRWGKFTHHVAGALLQHGIACLGCP